MQPIDTDFLAATFGLGGKRALITGASSGIGAHLAGSLGRAGAEVILTARRSDKLDAIRAKLHAQGLSAHVQTLDVTDAASVDAAAQAVGPLDILINNSGVSSEAMLADMSERDWDRVFDTNLKGAWRVSRAFAPALIASRGVILNVASILGMGVLKTVGAYAASKAGLIQLTRAMALELAQDGVRVNALAPGYIETPINAAFFATPQGAKMLRGVPQRRLGQPADLDAAVLALVGPGGQFTTGATIVVDGGHTLSLS
ncbi:SDR family NAD(P)-dependent oxidoreductase [Tropicimonas sp. S265A]|uniref:SDR family NAD(P)-dependent oxidoreductase n=1 Tax=Tropicimonas sp. S265A TaxID=3415134 RepID=UPI003C7BE22D